MKGCLSIRFKVLQQWVKHGTSRARQTMRSVRYRAKSRVRRDVRAQRRWNTCLDHGCRYLSRARLGRLDEVVADKNGGFVCLRMFRFRVIDVAALGPRTERSPSRRHGSWILRHHCYVALCDMDAKNRSLAFSWENR